MGHFVEAIVVLGSFFLVLAFLATLIPWLWQHRWWVQWRFGRRNW